VNADRLCLTSAVVLVLGAFAPAIAVAQQSLESDYRMTGRAIVAPFDGARAVLQTSSALILNGRDEIGYGVVISADGHILTKASEFPNLGTLTVVVDRARFDEVKLLAMDPTWDVALLKVDAKDLVPVNFAPSGDVPQGTWVIANGATTRTKRRALVGIVSAKTREIPAAGGAALGIVLAENAKKLKIGEVSENSGAKEADLRKGDIIIELEGTKVSKITDLAEVLKDRKAGSVVKVTLMRGKEKLTVDVRLSAKGDLFSEMANRNDLMSGDFSRRRSGFPRVMQHDILLNSKTTGGPLLDLDGRCLGMNIARANRAESFAIPLEDLKTISDKLMREAAAPPPAPADSTDGEPIIQ
jgi:serine protease Do